MQGAYADEGDNFSDSVLGVGISPDHSGRESPAFGSPGKVRLEAYKLEKKLQESGSTQPRDVGTGASGAIRRTASNPARKMEQAEDKDLPALQSSGEVTLPTASGGKSGLARPPLSISLEGLGSPAPSTPGTDSPLDYSSNMQTPEQNRGVHFQVLAGTGAARRNAKHAGTPHPQRSSTSFQNTNPRSEVSFEASAKPEPARHAARTAPTPHPKGKGIPNFPHTSDVTFAPEAAMAEDEDEAPESEHRAALRAGTPHPKKGGATTSIFSAAGEVQHDVSFAAGPEAESDSQERAALRAGTPHPSKHGANANIFAASEDSESTQVGDVRFADASSISATHAALRAGTPHPSKHANIFAAGDENESTEEGDVRFADASSTSATHAALRAGTPHPSKHGASANVFAAGDDDDESTEVGDVRFADSSSTSATHAALRAGTPHPARGGRAKFSFRDTETPAGAAAVQMDSTAQAGADNTPAAEAPPPAAVEVPALLDLGPPPSNVGTSGLQRQPSKSKEDQLLPLPSNAGHSPIPKPRGLVKNAPSNSRLRNDSSKGTSSFEESARHALESHQVALSDTDTSSPERSRSASPAPRHTLSGRGSRPVFLPASATPEDGGSSADEGADRWWGGGLDMVAARRDSFSSIPEEGDVAPATGTMSATAFDRAGSAKSRRSSMLGMPPTPDPDAGPGGSASGPAAGANSEGPWGSTAKRSQGAMSMTRGSRTMSPRLRNAFAEIQVKEMEQQLKDVRARMIVIRDELQSEREDKKLLHSRIAQLQASAAEAGQLSAAPDGGAAAALERLAAAREEARAATVALAAAEHDLEEERRAAAKWAKALSDREAAAAERDAEVAKREEAAATKLQEAERELGLAREECDRYKAALAEDDPEGRLAQLQDAAAEEAEQRAEAEGALQRANKQVYELQEALQQREAQVATEAEAARQAQELLQEAFFQRQTMEDRLAELEEQLAAVEANEKAGLVRTAKAAQQEAQALLEQKRTAESKAAEAEARAAEANSEAARVQRELTAAAAKLARIDEAAQDAAHPGVRLDRSRAPSMKYKHSKNVSVSDDRVDAVINQLAGVNDAIKSLRASGEVTATPTIPESPQATGLEAEQAARQAAEERAAAAEAELARVNGLLDTMQRHIQASSETPEEEDPQLLAAASTVATLGDTLRRDGTLGSVSDHRTVIAHSEGADSEAEAELDGDDESPGGEEEGKDETEVESPEGGVVGPEGAEAGKEGEVGGEGLEGKMKGDGKEEGIAEERAGSKRMRHGAAKSPRARGGGAAAGDGHFDEATDATYTETIEKLLSELWKERLARQRAEIAASDTAEKLQALVWATGEEGGDKLAGSVDESLMARLEEERARNSSLMEILQTAQVHQELLQKRVAALEGDTRAQEAKLAVVEKAGRRHIDAALRSGSLQQTLRRASSTQADLKQRCDTLELELTSTRRMLNDQAAHFKATNARAAADAEAGEVAAAAAREETAREREGRRLLEGVLEEGARLQRDIFKSLQELLNYLQDNGHLLPGSQERAPAGGAAAGTGAGTGSASPTAASLDALMQLLAEAQAHSADVIGRPSTGGATIKKVAGSPNATSVLERGVGPVELVPSPKIGTATSLSRTNNNKKAGLKSVLGNTISVTATSRPVK